jgi:hypothetical protein
VPRKTPRRQWNDMLRVRGVFLGTVRKNVALLRV